VLSATRFHFRKTELGRRICAFLEKPFSNVWTLAAQPPLQILQRRNLFIFIY